MTDNRLKPMSQAKRDDCRALIDSIKATGNCKSREALMLMESEYDTFQKVFEENGMKGVKDFDGNVVVPAIFDDVVETYSASCSGNLIPVVKDGLVGLVAPDGTGKVIVGFEYDSIHFVGYGFMCIKDEQEGLLSCSGQVIVPCEMDEIYEPLNDLIVFEKDGKRGYLCGGVFSKDLYEEDFIDDNDMLRVCRFEDREIVCGYLDKEGCFTTDADEGWFGMCING
ncbi:MAG: WG repeat-containing protein [Candidatus Cryptobacteroides sp.]